jgi:hypothetical protein
MRLRPISLIGLSLLAAACSNAGGQTGDLSGQNGQEGGGTVDSPANCKEERRKLGSFDEATDLGTANGLLSFAERSFDAPVTWQPRTGQTWHVAPESGQGSIHIEVTRGENAYYVTSTPKVSENDRADGPGTGLAAALCPAPRLAVDAHVTVSSDGGALAESFDTTLYASYRGVASFSVPVDLDKLDGTLSVAYDDPQTELVQVGLGATLTEAGMTGSLSGLLQRTTADAVSAMPGGGVIAVWPASAACASEPYGDLSGIGVTGEQNALGITGDAAAELLAQTTPASVTWRDGTSTQLTLAVELTGEGCLRASTIYGLDGSARYPAHFTLTSADGRLNASYDGVLESTPDRDANGVHGEAFLELELDQMTQSGFEGVAVPPAAERLGVRFSVDVDGAGQTSGLVQLNGLADPPCVTDPAVPEPGSGQGQGSPGCAGTTIIAVESATWGAD